MKRRRNIGNGMCAPHPQAGHRTGVVLSFDMALSLTLMVAIIVASFAYLSFSARPSYNQSSPLLRPYLQDTATVATRLGYLSAPIALSNKSNTSGIRQVLRALPSAVCMQVDTYGIAVKSGLVGYWPFDADGGGNIQDYSGNHLSGTVGGHPSFVSGERSGQAISLDGADDYADIGLPPLANLSNRQFTLAAWFLTNSSTTQAIMSKSTDYRLYKSGDTIHCSSGASDSGALIPGVQPDGKWHHAACAYNETALLLYIDGTLVATTAKSDLITTSAQALRIGGRDTVAAGNADPFRGFIDEARIYDRPLAAEEIKALYLNPANLMYSVAKEKCGYGGGPMGSLTVPFLHNANQEKNEYYYAVFRAWYKTN